MDAGKDQQKHHPSDQVKLPNINPKSKVTIPAGGDDHKLVDKMVPGYTGQQRGSQDFTCSQTLYSIVDTKKSIFPILYTW